VNPLLGNLTPSVQGHTHPGFSGVADAFEESFKINEFNAEVGATCAVMLDGEMVVDLWGGYADLDSKAPWQRDTLVSCWSVSKSLGATLGLMLVEQGLLELDRPVADYWPEFGQCGKQAVLVRHLLDHRAGLSYVDPELEVGDQYRWDVMVRAIENTAPNWPPGSRHGYLNMTMGYLLGELFVRVNGGRQLAQFVREELAGPLGLDWHFAVPEEVLPRVATVYRKEGDSVADAVAAAPDSLFAQSMKGFDPNEDYNSKAWRGAQVGSGSSHGNARAMARLFGCLARGGELDGVRLVSEETLRLAYTEVAIGEDALLGLPMRYSTGFEMTCPPALPMGPSDSAFGYVGAGGAFAFADPTRKFAFGYSPNFMHMGVGPGQAGLALVNAAIGCL
jgi:CubicO group peptidase (beta-lactamase class C family)